MPIKNIDGNGTIQAWFPTTIYYHERLISEEENETEVGLTFIIKMITKNIIITHHHTFLLYISLQIQRIVEI